MTAPTRAARLLRVRTIAGRASAMRAAAASAVVASTNAQLARIVELASATALPPGLANGAAFAAAAECTARLNIGHASVARRRDTEVEDASVASVRAQRAKADTAIAERFEVRVSREAARAADSKWSAQMPGRGRGL